MPSIDIDRDSAHQAAQTELGRAIYQQGSAGERLARWISETIYRLLEKTATIPGGWFTATVLFVLLAVAVLVAVHIARRTMRTRHGGDYQLFGATQLTAAQHRASAESSAAEEDWSTAIRHRLRAVARQLEETGVLEPAPGRTANELARDAGAALPHLADEMASAATSFNDVTYGEQPGSEDSYRMIVDLDERLRSRSPAGASVTGQPAAAESWAHVR